MRLELSVEALRTEHGEMKSCEEQPWTLQR